MCKALNMSTAVTPQLQSSNHPLIHTPAYPEFITIPGHVRKNRLVLYIGNAVIGYLPSGQMLSGQKPSGYMPSGHLPSPEVAKRTFAHPD